jgi:hypothetical protein
MRPAKRKRASSYQPVTATESMRIVAGLVIDLRYFSSTHRTDLSRFRGTFHRFDPVGFAIFAIYTRLGRTSWNALVEDGSIVATGFLAES